MPTGKKKSKKKTFSVTKAVKANARDRVGAPPPARVIPEESKIAERERKHKPTLSQLLANDE